MYFRHCGWLLVAALTLVCALSAAPSTAAASGGTYTQILCANPDTGWGVLPQDAKFPEGISVGVAHHASMEYVERDSRCSGRVGPDTGFLHGARVPLTATGDQASALRYDAPQDIRFGGGTIYRYSTTAGGSRWSTSITGGPSYGVYYLPRWELCEWSSGCVTKGATAAPFGELNRVSLGTSSEMNGFWTSVLCNVAPGSGSTCPADGNQIMRIYGGKLTLEDKSNPIMTGTPEGTMVEDTVLRGTEEVTLNATDTGSGVYRVQLLLDNAPKLSQVVDGNIGRCTDVNANNADPYEFAYSRPCKLSAGGTFAFDTTSLDEGSHNLKIQVEDASGNATTTINRTVTVDNIPAPSNIAAPSITGTLQKTHRLTAETGTWDDHGAAGDPVVTRQWQRCDRVKANCVDIADATDEDYVLTHDEVGRTVRVVVVAKNDEGETQAASPVSNVVTLADGTLPDDRDGNDNDGDGLIDEPGEKTPDPVTPPPGPAAGPGGLGGSSARQVTATSQSQVNGQGASRQARLTVAYADTKNAKLTTKYGKSRVIMGRLTDEHGRPISNAIVEVSSVAAINGAGPVAGKSLVTGADGSFRYTASGKTASRTIRFGYRFENPGAVVADGALQLLVNAGVKLSVKLRGSRVTYSGRVLSGPIPKSGKLVVIQGRVRRASWQTFATPRARGKGTFKGVYRLKVRRPGTKLQFRARVLTEAGYPYVSMSGPTLTRKVR